MASLIPLRAEDGKVDGLLIETNEPELVDLDFVYQHFRRQEMTYEEYWKESLWVDPVRRFKRQVDALSQNERELYEEASTTQPIRGEVLAVHAGHEYDGQIKGCLSLLVKLGLLKKVRGGYLRAGCPKRPYD